MPAPIPKSSKSAEDKATSLPAKQPSGAAASDKSTSPPATAEQVSAPARSGPRIASVKTNEFGKLDTDYDPIGLDKETQ